MHRLVLHAGKRVSDAESKVDIEDARRCYAWVEREFGRFLTDLPEPYKSAWDWKADPLRIVITAGNSALSATNSTQSISATFPARPTYS
jgi:hypothetical protein